MIMNCAFIASNFHILGLYKVERYWQAVGLSGFKVYKFVLSRCENQPPGPWMNSQNETEEANVNSNEERTWESDTSR